MKIIKILELNANHKIPHENHKNHEDHRIPNENNENHKKFSIPQDTQENYETLRILCEN